MELNGKFRFKDRKYYLCNPIFRFWIKTIIQMNGTSANKQPVTRGSSCFCLIFIEQYWLSIFGQSRAVVGSNNAEWAALEFILLGNIFLKKLFLNLPGGGSKIEFW